MGKVATAIVGLKERTWVEVLADKVFGFQDISIDDLELVFDEYYKNEVEAKAFMLNIFFLRDCFAGHGLLNMLMLLEMAILHFGNYLSSI
ncbi:uncharacterized protein A4U43_C03F21610 [Asparagus officinalis]|uniref:Uncharacterized protein n=1 Tax=Asparagus officinalis TaxID=4686 RepID=A0A5P1FBW9_ASPOF|nr:uncharacterized protein A4U43_C03F21610 [Asparagus officinalis]